MGKSVLKVEGIYMYDLWTVAENLWTEINHGCHYFPGEYVCFVTHVACPCLFLMSHTQQESDRQTRLD